MLMQQLTSRSLSPSPLRSATKRVIAAAQVADTDFMQVAEQPPPPPLLLLLPPLLLLLLLLLLGLLSTLLPRLACTAPAGITCWPAFVCHTPQDHDGIAGSQQTPTAAK
jgi:hypothetical protein